MPQQRNQVQHEYSQKQKDQLRSRTGVSPDSPESSPPDGEKTTLNTSEVQEGPKGSLHPIPDYESEENEGGSTQRRPA